MRLEKHFIVPRILNRRTLLYKTVYAASYLYSEDTTNSRNLKLEIHDINVDFSCFVPKKNHS